MLAFNRISSTFSEVLANRLLSLDCEANDKLRQFEGHSIHIAVDDLNLNYYLRFPNGSIVISDQQKETPSATIRGNANAFVNAAISEKKGDSLFTGQLHFSGDIGLAQRFQALLSCIELDWQRPLSDLVGDEFAYGIGETIKKGLTLAQNAWQQTMLDIPEYVQEELKVSPGPYELEDFYSQIDLTRSQVERLAARIDRLKSHD